MFYVANFRISDVSPELQPEDLGSEVTIVKAPFNLWREHKAPPFPFTAHLVRGDPDSLHQRPCRSQPDGTGFLTFHKEWEVPAFAWFSPFSFPPRASATSWVVSGWAATLEGPLPTDGINATGSLGPLCSSTLSALPWGHVLLHFFFF